MKDRSLLICQLSKVTVFSNIEELLVRIAEDVGAHPEEGGDCVIIFGLVNDRKVSTKL